MNSEQISILVFGGVICVGILMVGSCTMNANRLDNEMKITAIKQGFSPIEAQCARIRFDSHREDMCTTFIMNRKTDK